MQWKKCDLVMKGGITSGIVYPRAVCELAKEFEFVNIGGASAGAIAAALTAAAELRRKNGSDDGFKRLEQLPGTLGSPSDGERSRLFQLFEPSNATRPFFDAGVRWLETKSIPAAIGVLLSHFNTFSAVAAIVFVLAIGVAFAAFQMDGLLRAVTLLGAIVIAISAVVGLIAASVIEAVLAAKRILPQTNFGLCDGKAIAKWLMEEVDVTAGNTSGRPLTFGDLSKAGITLEMMTTNLTFGQPRKMPWTDKRFSFHRGDLEELFPEPVVTWMLAHSERIEETELYTLPDPDELPVVVAARMSMSFPGLLAAVPLYMTDHGVREEREKFPERCWFSDGGIGSNFPVHFFDAPLPTWPTFAINLAEWSERYHDDGQTIYAPRTNRGGIHGFYTSIDSIVAFAVSIIETMHNWRDNDMLRMPGYRDRIAHVLLRGGEGGLNLTMNDAMIDSIAARGHDAAVALRERFGDQLPRPDDLQLSWTNHQWVRFRAFMGALEDALQSYAKNYDARIFDGPPSYAPSSKMRDKTDAFVKHIHENFEGGVFGEGRPKPESVLRAMPDM